MKKELKKRIKEIKANTELHFEKGKNITFDVIPYALIDDGKWLHVLEGEQKEKVLAYLDKLSAVIQDREKVERLFDAWSFGMKSLTCYLAYKPEFEAAELPTDVHRTLAPTRNVLSCEAHNHLLTHLLRMEHDGRIGEAKAAVAELEALKEMPY